ncbi:MAG: hypothetical protein WCF84_08890 [Anaerolineae bacterium]
MRLKLSIPPIWFGALFLLLLNACTGAGAPVQASVTRALQSPTSLPIPTTIPISPTAPPTLSPSPTPTLIATPTPDGRPLLEWEGSVATGNDPQACKALQVGVNYAIEIGECQQPLQTGSMIRQEMVRAMFTRFAPFEYQTDKDRLVFRGRGTIADPIWHPAVLAWVHNAYRELATGHVCASCSTTFTWSLGQVSGQPRDCQIVYVLAWGYANAGAVPCQGGNPTTLYSDWLTTAEWQTLNDLTNRGAINPDTTGWDKGSSMPGNDRRTAQLQEWTRGVYARLVH